MDTKQLREIQAKCEADGFHFSINKWPSKSTWYKPNGEAMPNLPSDPVTMIRYFNKGFTLTPPRVLSETRGKPEFDTVVAQEPTEPEKVVVNDWEGGNVATKVTEVTSVLTCSCGFKAKTLAGKKSHERFCRARN